MIYTILSWETFMAYQTSTNLTDTHLLNLAHHRVTRITSQESLSPLVFVRKCSHQSSCMKSSHNLQFRDQIQGCTKVSKKTQLPQVSRKQNLYKNVTPPISPTLDPHHCSGLRPRSSVPSHDQVLPLSTEIQPEIYHQGLTFASQDV